MLVAKTSVAPLLLVAALLTGQCSAEPSPWRVIDKGLCVGSFKTPRPTRGDSMITIVRVDPKRYDLRLLTSTQYKNDGLTAQEWCRKYHLIAAINAGMFQPDYKTNVGYMKNFAHCNNAHVNKAYQSIAACNPVDSSKPRFAIFDGDRTPIGAVIKNYRTVIQNLRLIKRSGRNVWPEQGRQWSEAALGEDSSGNALLIFCRSPYSMHDFNEILLGLPISLVSAQHLEGGPKASLYFHRGAQELKCMGSYETGFNAADRNDQFLPIPNVWGITKREK